MRLNAVLFWILCLFFGILAVVYPVWSLLDTNELEAVGTVGLSLASVFSGFIGFYLQRSYNAQGGDLPEDRLDGNIDDGDPELGFFSPWSWWPIGLAASAALGFLGLAVGFWITFVGVGLFLVMIVGWVYEYYRGFFAR
ncbi:cytochrome c oxidase subunit 4 [Naasia aerilata]|uniref:Cytochrome c oxidase polypeptide 4 n=1 Tax=Naasia aerilata TaxID=1162966 RepID=A0ABM8GG36_9MICO|nr:cytochrome c oxidase subunit 4 [Naasia aerilata]BDZ47327.1 putative cytochrome c oxidase polypeptide 4 [Naasia aerilata]